MRFGSYCGIFRWFWALVVGLFTRHFSIFPDENGGVTRKYDKMGRGVIAYRWDVE